MIDNCTSHGSSQTGRDEGSNWGKRQRTKGDLGGRRGVRGVGAGRKRLETYASSQAR